MGEIILWKYCAWLALFASPAIPLALAWRAVLKPGHPRRSATLVAGTVACFSLLWFVAATMDYRFIGPLYGVFHYFITAGNLITVIVCGLFCLVTSIRGIPRAARLLIGFACFMLAVEWALLGIANR